MGRQGLLKSRVSPLEIRNVVAGGTGKDDFLVRMFVSEHDVGQGVDVPAFFPRFFDIGLGEDVVDVAAGGFA